MKFKNKKTGAIVETNIKAVEELYAKKSDYEEIKEPAKKKVEKAE